ncbi:hypothetical protein ACOSQ4_023067 [Xanthoceras sorbifolium]
MTDVQSLRMSHNSNTIDSENPFAPAESSHQAQTTVPIYSVPISNRNHHSKLTFPNFNGEDPTKWIYKAEQFFKFKNITPYQQVQLVSFHLEGIALQWLTKFGGPLTWVEFTTAVYLRFEPTDYEDPSNALTRLKQTTTVEACQESFEKLSYRVDNLSKLFLVGFFIDGLCNEIRLVVKVKQPKTLTDVIGVSRLIEERNSLLKKIGNGINSRPNTNPHQRTHKNPSTGLLGPPLTTKIGYTPNP